MVRRFPGLNYPEEVVHWIDGRLHGFGGASFPKHDPSTGLVLAEVARGGADVVDSAVKVASKAQLTWASVSPLKRGEVIRAIAQQMEMNRDLLAEVVSLETGKSKKDALGEVGAAIEQGYFVAGEGRRFYGRTTTSAVANRSARTVRAPVGVCALIIPANTPIANIAWKVFPALLCGNAVVLKPPEDCPYIALVFAELVARVGLSSGVFNVVQGFGAEAGNSLLIHPEVDLVSFTGGTRVGKEVARLAGTRLARVILELGGKNALLVCDDANLDRAVADSVASSFSNAGQRCASSSRILVFDEVYERFKSQFVARTGALSVGSGDDNDLGPVINSRQLESLTGLFQNPEALGGGRILTGGHRLQDPSLGQGYFFSPTVVEEPDRQCLLSKAELFGPVTCLYRVKSFGEAIELINDCDYGLTAAIHTASLHRAERFQSQVRTGVVSINGPTFGSEPHLPFGGYGQSGNGWREAGTEAIDAYSEWKTVYTIHDPEAV